MIFSKCFLNRVQLLAIRKAFDCSDFTLMRLKREHRARFHRAAIQQHRTSAAIRGVAADVRAAKVQLLADKFHEQHARRNGALVELAVHPHCDGN